MKRAWKYVSRLGMAALVPRTCVLSAAGLLLLYIIVMHDASTFLRPNRLRTYFDNRLGLVYCVSEQTGMDYVLVVENTKYNHADTIDRDRKSTKIKHETKNISRLITNGIENKTRYARYCFGRPVRFVGYDEYNSSSGVERSGLGRVRIFGTSVSMPHRFFLLPTAGVILTAFAVSLAIVITFEMTQAWIRVSRGKCVRCGYDVRTSPSNCPECGASGGWPIS